MADPWQDRGRGENQCSLDQMKTPKIAYNKSALPIPSIENQKSKIKNFSWG
jgi:hypothetical protein